jgi:transcriptional antiterminator NusG
MTDSTIEQQTTPRWYVLRTYTGHERRVQKAIEQEIKHRRLQERILRIVIPEETVFEIRRGKRREKKRNFLPGYILIEAVLDKKLQDIILSITGVSGFLGVNDRLGPQPLKPDEVERILSRIEERKDIATIENAYQIGDPVKIIDGPFKGFAGTVTEVNNEKQKLKVEVAILGRKTPVELDFAQVEIERPE